MATLFAPAAHSAASGVPVTWPRAVPLARVLTLADPLECSPWDVTVTVADVAAALSGQPCDHPEDEHVVAEMHGWNQWCVRCEARKIARYVLDGIPTDDPYPVSLDFGCLGWEPDWPLIDGNHRVAAAKIRGDKTIVVDVAGDLDVAEAALLGLGTVAGR